jgi:hypothetical protein
MGPPGTTPATQRPPPTRRIEPPDTPGMCSGLAHNRQSSPISTRQGPFGWTSPHGLYGQTGPVGHSPQLRAYGIPPRAHKQLAEHLTDERVTYVSW